MYLALGPAHPALAGNALPDNGRVVAGSATISQPSANALTVTQSSQNAVVNWNSFSIGSGNSVTFNQPNASAAILNRVTGNESSVIAGSLKANGRVYLVNPNGIAITPSGAVDVGGGFIASSLDITNDDFLAGNLRFSGSGASGQVSNAGRIGVGSGGFAALLGGNVVNSGSISVPMGRVGLGAGERATLDLDGTGFLQVALPTKRGGGDRAIDHSGTITANGGRVEIKAATARDAVRNVVNISGRVSATSVGGRNGAIVFGAGPAGRMRVSGDVSVASADKTSGGRIAMDAGATDLAGARLDASSALGSGGRVVVTGEAITVSGAAVDASGATGGGQIRIGGDVQGGGDIPRARTLSLVDVVLKADALTSGDGGSVVLWSDEATDFAGSISARAFGTTGNGGFAEVSSLGKLIWNGLADLRSEGGRFGTLLLDPRNITISSGDDSGHSGFTANADDTVINVTTLQNQLALANVTVFTGNTGSQAGNITVASNITWSANTLLTLQAAGNINLGTSVITAGNGAGSGVTFITGGAGGVSGTGGGIVLAGGGTATFNVGGSGSGTYSGVISGAGAVTKTGTGMLTLSVNNTYTGRTSVAQGTLWLIGTGMTNELNTVAGATLQVGMSADIAFGGAGVTLRITGNGTVEKVGTGSWTPAGGADGADLVEWRMSGGVVRVSQGRLGAAGSFKHRFSDVDPSSGTGTPTWRNMASLEVAAGATWRSSESYVYFDGLSGSGTIQFGFSGHGALRIGSGGASSTFGGTIELAFAGATPTLEKLGTGTLTLSGTNTYTGRTIVSAGTLTFANRSALYNGVSGNWTAANIVVAQDATLGLRYGGVGEFTAADINAISQLNDGIGGGFQFASFLGIDTTSGDRAYAFAIADTLNNTSRLRLAKLGTNTLTLTGNNTNTGFTDVRGGTLQIGDGGTTGRLGTGNIFVAAGTTLAFNRSDDVTLGSGNSITGAGSVAQVGPGKTTFIAGNGYTGGTAVLQGTLEIGDGGTLGGGNVAISAGATLAFNQSYWLPVANVISGAGNVLQSGTGSTTLSGNNTYTGTTTVSNGTLEIGGSIGTAGTLGTGVVVNNGTLVFNRADALTVANAISGTGAVIKRGTGTTTLTGTNTYTGRTTVEVGTLTFANTGALYGGNSQNWTAANIVVNGGATLGLRYGGAGEFTQAQIDAISKLNDGIGGGFQATAFLGIDTTSGDRTYALAITNTANNTLLRLAKLGANTLTLTGNNTNSGITEVRGGTLQIGNGGTTGQLNAANITVSDGATLAFNRSDDVIIYNAILGSGGVTQAGSGKTTFAGGVTYTGATNVNAGTLVFTGDSKSATLNIASGGVLEWNVAPSSELFITADQMLTGAGTFRKTGTGTLIWGSRSMNFAMSAGGLIDVQQGLLQGDSSANEIWTNNFASLNVAAGAEFRTGATNVRIDGLTGAGVVRTGITGYGYIGLTIGVANGSATFTGTISNEVAAGNIIKVGTGTQILAGNNTYSGGTTVAAGTLVATVNTTQTGIGSGPVSVASGAALQMNNTNTSGLTVTMSNTFTGGGSITLNFAAGGASRNTVMSGLAGFTGVLNLTASGTTFDKLAQLTNIGGSLSVGSNTTLFVAGNTTVSGGITLASLGNADGLGAIRTDATLTANIALAADSTIGSFYTGTFAGNISGEFALTKQGNGTVILTGTNTYTTTTISGGTLQIGAGGTSGTLGTGNVVNNAALAFNRSDSITVAHSITGGGSLSKLGSNTLTLTGTNNYNLTTISGGTLQIGDGGTQGTLGFGAVTNNGALVFNRSNAISVNNSISGSGTVTKLGGGTLTLSGTNTYSGRTTVSAGILTFANRSALYNGVTGSWTASNLVVESGATLAVRYGGAGEFTSADLDLLRVLGTASDGFRSGAAFGIDTTSGNRTYASAITNTNGGANVLNLVKLGANTLTLTGNSSYSGTTTIAGGTLQIGNGGTTGTIGTGAVVNNGTLAFSRSDAVTFAINISGTGTLTKLGTNTLTLTGNNSYSGGTAINAGTLNVGSAGALGSTGTITFGGGTLQYSAANQTDYSGRFSDAGNQAWSIDTNGQNVTFASALTGGTSILAKLGAGTLTLTGANSYGYTTIAAGGTLQIGDGVTAGAIGLADIDNAGSLVFNLPSNANITLQQVIAGTGSLTVSGQGSLTLAAAPMSQVPWNPSSPYQMTWTASSGGTWAVNGAWSSTMVLPTNAPAGTLFRFFNQATSAINVRATPGAATNIATAGPNGSSMAFYYDGSTWTYLGAAPTANLSSTSLSNSYSGGTTIASGATLRVGAGGTVGSLGSGGVTNNGTLVFDRSDALTVGNAITGNGLLRKLGENVLTLTGTNAYFGSTTVSAGTLRAGSSSAFGTNSAVTVDAGATLDVAGRAVAIGSLAGGGTVTNSNTTEATLTVGNNTNTSTTFSGMLQSGAGPLHLAKVGTSTLVLTGENRYAYTTIAAGGTLQIGDGITAGVIGLADIDNAGSLVFNLPSSANVILQQVITGTGSLTVSGQGSVTLAAPSSMARLPVNQGFPYQLTHNSTSAGDWADNGAWAPTVLLPTNAPAGTLYRFFNKANGSVAVRATAGAATDLVSGNASWAFYYDGSTWSFLGTAPTANLASTSLSNSYSGGTTIASGATLRVGAGGTAGALGTGSVTNNGTLVFNRSDAINVSQNISGAGSLTKLGANTLTLTGNNTYTGATNVNAGTLVFTGDSKSATLNIASGAVLEWNVASNLDNSVSQTITGSGTFRKTGSGLIVWGASVATFAMGMGGLIDVQAGGFVGGHWGNENWTANLASLNVAAGAVVLGGEGNIRIDALTGSGQLQTGASVGGYTGLTLGVAGGGGTFTGQITNGPAAGNIVKVGTGTQILAGNNTYTGTTTISGGTLQIGAGGTSGTLGTGAVVNNATLAFNRSNAMTVANAISGTGGVTQAGAGTTTLSGTTTYTGATNVNAGTLVFTGDSKSATLNIASGAVLEWNVASGSLNNSASQTLTGTGTFRKTGTGELLWGTAAATFAMGVGGWIDIQGGSLAAGSWANENWTNNFASLNLGASGVIIDGEANIRVDALTGSGLIRTGATFGGYANITIGVGNSGGTFTGSIQNLSATGNLVKVGTGTQILAGNNTYTGTTTISGGTLQIGAGGTSGTLGTGAVVNNGTLVFNRSDAVTVANGITGNGALTKLGANTLTLTGTNSYAGTTTVSSGTLRIGGTWNVGVGNTASVTVGSGATLAGSGIVTAGTLAISGQGTIDLTGANQVGALTTSGTLAGLNFVSGRSLSVGSIAATGAVTLRTTAGSDGDITLLSGAVLTSAATGDAVVVATDRNFVNQSGAGAIALTAAPGTARWLVYAAAPETSTFGNLDSANGAVWGTNYVAGASPSVSGNRYVFKQAREIGVVAASGRFAKTYGDAYAFSAGLVAGQDFVLSGLSGGIAGAFLADQVTGSAVLASTGTSATAGAGAYDVTVAQGGLSGPAGVTFRFDTLAGGFSVGQRAITVTADAQSRTYGDANPALTYTVGGQGLANGDSLSLTTAASATSGIGAYAISLNPVSSNYTVTYQGANLTVTPRAITVTADAQSRTYGDANPALTYTVGGQGLANGDTISLATAANQTSDVGTYAITLNPVSSNYTVTYTGANLTVVQRAITVTAHAKSRGVGVANPVLTYTLGGQGLVAGDVLTGELSTAATTTSQPGNYAITQGTLAAPANYAVSYNGAMLTVTPHLSADVVAEHVSVSLFGFASRAIPDLPISAPIRSGMTTIQQAPTVLKTTTGTASGVSCQTGFSVGNQASALGAVQCSQN